MTTNHTDLIARLRAMAGHHRDVWLHASAELADAAADALEAMQPSAPPIEEVIRLAMLHAAFRASSGLTTGSLRDAAETMFGKEAVSAAVESFRPQETP